MIFQGFGNYIFSFGRQTNPNRSMIFLIRGRNSLFRKYASFRKIHPSNRKELSYLSDDLLFRRESVTVYNVPKNYI